MPQDNARRGSHFAPAGGSSPAKQDKASLQAQDEATRDVLRTWGAAVSDPGETAVFLRAAGVKADAPMKPLSTARPDETAVFLAAARGVSSHSEGLSSPLDSSVLVPAAPLSDKPLLSDDDWSPRGFSSSAKEETSADDWKPEVGERIEGVSLEDADDFENGFDGGSAREAERVTGSEDAVFAPLPSDTAAFASDLVRAAGSFADPGTDESPETVDAPVDATVGSDEDSDDVDDMGSSDYASVGRSATLMTALTIVSRVTGFIRTWAMAAAIGMSLLSSSYQVANNLPNMLYELVMGGMLVTAFLPVYMGVRREQGREASNEYVGNLLGILLLVLGVISVLGTVFAPGFIWTQSFLSGDTGSMDTAVFLFRFFAIQILFYGLGSVFSGVLNAHRDYFWSTFAPVLNNVIVIASFMGFGPVSAINETAGVVLIAAGTTLGVFVQMLSLIHI